ncbi:MAG TPA: OpgC domain-containing protein [Opitutaceae bacterium]|nr:OpgC domain-containing protein [Opitutaceae bacterium]
MAPPPVGGRDLRIDSLRGLLLVFMAIDHIASDVQIATNHIFGYVSAAEGFVFISGFVAGLVYTRRRWTAGAEAAQDASWRRAAILYAYHLALFLFVWNWTLGGHLVRGESPIAPSGSLASMRMFFAGLLAINQPPLLDILPMYCGFMVLLPTLLAAFDRGRRAQVLAISVGIWALSNAFLPQAPWSFGVVQTSSLSVTAWQLLFVGGAAFGHAWVSGKRLLPRPTPLLIGAAAAFCAVCYVVRHAFIAPPIPRGLLDWLTNKNNVAPVRLLDTAALFYLVAVVAGRFPRLVQWRPLAFLGRNALPVFSVHVAVAYVLGAFPAIFADSITGRWLGTLLMIGAMAATALAFNRRPARIVAAQPA